MKGSMKYLRIFVTLVVAGLLASCSDSTDGSGSIAGWTIPGMGTQFVFVNTFVGGVPADDTLQVLVDETGQNNGGQSNVVVLAESYSTGSSSIVDYVIQRNGDFWISDEINSNFEVSNWDPYPTGSHDTLVGPVIDSSFVPGYYVWKTDTNYYVDSEKISTPVGSFSTIRVESRLWQKLLDSSTRQIEITYDTLDYWFAPSAGYYVKAMIRGYNNWTANLITYLPH
jgi:hypothetical protein